MLNLDKQIEEAKSHLSPIDKAFIEQKQKEIKEGSKGGTLDLNKIIEDIKDYANNK